MLSLQGRMECKRFFDAYYFKWSLTSSATNVTTPEVKWGRDVFLPTKKTFEGICFALERTFLKKSCEFFCTWKPSAKNLTH